MLIHDQINEILIKNFKNTVIDLNVVATCSLVFIKEQRQQTSIVQGS